LPSRGHEHSTGLDCADFARALVLTVVRRERKLELKRNTPTHYANTVNGIDEGIGSCVQQVAAPALNHGFLLTSIVPVWLSHHYGLDTGTLENVTYFALGYRRTNAYEIYQVNWETILDKKLGLPAPLPVRILVCVVPVPSRHQGPVDVAQVTEIAVVFREVNRGVPIGENKDAASGSHGLHRGAKVDDRTLPARVAFNPAMVDRTEHW